MERDRLVLAVASVLAGVSVLLAVLGATYSLVFLAAAVPFGVTAYFMWYQATGRLAERTRARERTRTRAPGPFGARRTRTESQSRAGTRDFRDGRRRQSQRRASGGGSRRPGETSLSRREALAALGLDDGADDQAIRRAYRERVKEVHPDTEDGDEAEFKRVNRAYETLVE